jgi:hypothetical protein
MYVGFFLMTPHNTNILLVYANEIPFCFTKQIEGSGGTISTRQIVVVKHHKGLISVRQKEKNTSSHHMHTHIPASCVAKNLISFSIK